MSGAARPIDGDGVLAPGEQGTVTLTLDNDGPGVARAVRGALRVESPATGVRPRGAPPPLTLAAGRSGTIELRLVADSAQSSTEVVAVVRATEANGFDLAPSLRLRIPARPAGAARFRFVQKLLEKRGCANRQGGPCAIDEINGRCLIPA